MPVKTPKIPPVKLPKLKAVAAPRMGDLPSRSQAYRTEGRRAAKNHASRSA